MNVTVVAALSLIVFLVAFRVARAVPAATRAMGIFRQSMAAIGDSALTDQDRERIMRRGSGQLLLSFVSILARSGAALAAAMLPIVIADWAGWVRFAEVTGYLARVDTIVGATLLVGLGYFLTARRWRK